jgi:hypothetical protein
MVISSTNRLNAPHDTSVIPEGNTKETAAKLKQSTIQYGPGTEALTRQSTGSPHLDLLKNRLGEKGLERTFQRNMKVKAIMDRVDSSHPDAVRPEKLIKALASSPDSRFSKLKIEKGTVGNSYNPSENTVSLIDPSNRPYAAHELRHAYDHLQNKLDLRQPEQRLASEHNAFTSQVKTADELGESSGIDRPPLAQARTYEGKDGYPGTVEESHDAVKAWRDIRPTSE